MTEERHYQSEFAFVPLLGRTHVVCIVEKDRWYTEIECHVQGATRYFLDYAHPNHLRVRVTDDDAIHALQTYFPQLSMKDIVLGEGRLIEIGLATLAKEQERYYDDEPEIQE